MTPAELLDAQQDLWKSTFSGRAIYCFNRPALPEILELELDHDKLDRSEKLDVFRSLFRLTNLVSP